MDLKKRKFRYYCENCDFGVINETAYKTHLMTNKHKIRVEN